MRKAQVLPLSLIVITLILTIYYVGGTFFKDVSLTKQETMNYYVENANENVQLIKQAFEKTALFWGVMKTADELAESGGISSADLALGAADSDNFCPRMNTSLIGGENILYWALAGNKRIVKRVPFIYYLDKETTAYDVTFPLLNKAQHEQYLKDVSNKVYNLSMTIQVLFLKHGTVNITFNQDTRYATYIIDDTEKDGIYEINFLNDSFIRSTNDVDISIRGEDTAGNVEKIAKIKQIVVSIYNGTVVWGPNTILNSHLTAPVANLNTELCINADEEIKISVGTFEGSFSRKTASPDSPVSSLMWASDDEGIVATMKDPFDDSVDAVKIRSRGLVDEDVYVRYWYLYDAGVYFINNLDGLVKARIWDRLNTLEDYYADVGDQFCGKPGCQVNDSSTQSYSEEDIYDEIDAGLSDLTTKLNNAYNSAGIHWSISAPRVMLDDTSLDTNYKHMCSSSVETNRTGNIVYKDSYLSKCTQDGTLCGGKTCIRRKSCPTCYYTVGWQNKKYNTCTYYYGHIYIVKNIPVLVEITDTKYQITDSNGNQKNPTIKFFAEIDKVQDNCCNSGNTVCSSLRNSHCSNPYGKITPVAPPEVNLPLNITDVFVSDINENNVTINWQSTKDATSVLVVKNSLGATVYSHAYSLDTLFDQIVTGLAEDQVYTYDITVTSGAVTDSYSDTFTTHKTDTPPSPDPFCTITINPPVGGAILSGTVTITATVTCPPAIGNIVAADNVSFMLEQDYAPTSSALAGLTATYNLNWDSEVILEDGWKNISAKFTKTGKSVNDRILVILNNGQVTLNVNDIEIIQTSLTTVDVIVDLNKGSPMVTTPKLLNPDDTDTGIIPTESPANTYTFSLAGLSPDTHYPTTGANDNYTFYATDGADIVERNISFTTNPKITISTLDTTAEVVVETTRSALTMKLEDHNGVGAGPPNQIGNIYTFNLNGLSADTRYPHPTDMTKFYTLKINDAGTIEECDSLWFLRLHRVPAYIRHRKVCAV